MINWKIAKLVLNIDIINEVEVIVEVSLIVTKGFYSESSKLS